MAAIFLTMLLLLFSAPLITAQEEGQLQVLVFNAPNDPAVGSRWILTLLIAHNEPNEVTVLVPPFTGPLLLEQIYKGPRLRNTVTGQAYTYIPQPAAESAETGISQETAFERWTVIEYRFLLYNSGTVYFDSFTVITPGRQTRTAPFTLHVRSLHNAAETLYYQLSWEGAPSGLRIGENAVFSLRIRGWNPSMPLPEALLPTVPQGHILESLSVSPAERAAGIALKFRLIPIEAVPFILERRLIPHNGSLLEIPALQIPVRAAARATGNAVSYVPADEAVQAEISPFPPLETVNTRLFQRYQTEIEIIYGTVRDLWERGCRASALSTLRQNERDHPAGALFSPIRREAERALGLTGTNDEKRPNPLPFLRRQEHGAVLRETVIRRIPDPSGEILGRFREGQPVLVISPINPASGRREPWLRIITNDSAGITGWVPEDSIIMY
jgi:hypothetical protein